MIAMILLCAALVFAGVFLYSKKSTEDKWWIAIGLSVLAALVLYALFVIVMAIGMQNDIY